MLSFRLYIKWQRSYNFFQSYSYELNCLSCYFTWKNTVKQHAFLSGLTLNTYVVHLFHNSKILCILLCFWVLLSHSIITLSIFLFLKHSEFFEFIRMIFVPQGLLHIYPKSVGQQLRKAHPHSVPPPKQQMFFSQWRVKWASPQWKSGHVWTAECPPAAVGMCLPLAVQPGFRGSGHLRGQRASAGNLAWFP